MDETPDRGRKNPLQFVTKFFASAFTQPERARAREATYREQREAADRWHRPGAKERRFPEIYEWNFARNIYLRGGLRAVAVYIGFLAADVWDDLHDDHLADGFLDRVNGPSFGSLFLVCFLTTSVLWFFIAVLYRMDEKR